MKKLIYILIPTVLITIFSCIERPTEPSEPVPSDNNIVTIPDPAFEQIIRLAINVPTGNITKSHLDTLRMIESPYTGGDQVEDITGIENCNNLYWLDLSRHRISDISPLKDIGTLINIFLYNNNISEIDSLSNLLIVHELNLSRNNITDISPLKEFRKIRSLFLAENQIEDISPLENMSSLIRLTLGGNQIESIL